MDHLARLSQSWERVFSRATICFLSCDSNRPCLYVYVCEPLIFCNVSKFILSKREICVCVRLCMYERTRKTINFGDIKVVKFSNSRAVKVCICIFVSLVYVCVLMLL